MSVNRDAQKIIDAALAACMPDQAVRRAMSEHTVTDGRVILVAIGKAAWQMASCAAEILGEKLHCGIVITKYGHNKGDIARCRIVEAGHPVPDENSYIGTKMAMEMVTGLTERDEVVFLVSGGGSALFEYPLIEKEAMEDMTQQLLASGANIVEMNTIRKRLSAVKGGRFAQLCAPARVFSIVLSDIIGDPLDMIASGPAYPDSSACEDANQIVEKYHLKVTDAMQTLLNTETPKILGNVETIVTGSVRQLCKAAAETCQTLGYMPVFLTDRLACEAREAGAFLSAIARSHDGSPHSLAFIAGGETVVHLTGSGKGGRNQELALAAAEGISGMKDTVIFSLGSDGTDGPTDAAGGLVDGDSAAKLQRAGLSVYDVLQRNDAYHALKEIGGLLMTGPTGTNVNDVAVALLRR
ncbi:MAG: glycerate kinase [Oscillospiraceae bacterium]|nr:glycerate kinase [Oscillospiraceae bacterium]